MATRHSERARAPEFIDPPGYARHRPEQTLRYQFIEQHYPAFVALRAAQGRPLPRYVQEEFEGYLKCGRLEHGFLRVRCESCHAEKFVAFSCKGRGFCPSCGARRMAESAALLVDDVLPNKPLRQWVLSLPFALRFLLATEPQVVTRVLKITDRTIAGHLIKKAGLRAAVAETGAVTLIQRFGSALNLNIHLHMLVLDGVYLRGTEPPVFRQLAAPSAEELAALVQRLAERIGRALQRQGLLVRDCENRYLALDPTDGTAMNDLIGHSITYRVALGPRAGQKVFTLQTVPPIAAGEEQARGARASGFSLHAGVGAAGGERQKLERLCPMWLAPRCAGFHLPTRGAGAVAKPVGMTWRQRLQRVFAIDIETCRHCGGQLKVIASIEDPLVIGRILEHLDQREARSPSACRPRAPPQRELPL